jgi:small nuclear ribonucleoprotein (snRNP)-like protein
VLLPNNECCEGKLEHYSLHYNVALVSVKNYNVDCPANLKHQMMYYSTKVVAVGRCFEPDLIMAASGKCTRWSGKLDCIDLRYTTCTITKVARHWFSFLNCCMNMMYLALCTWHHKWQPLHLTWLGWDWRAPCWCQRQICGHELLW